MLSPSLHHQLQWGKERKQVLGGLYFVGLLLIPGGLEVKFPFHCQRVNLAPQLNSHQGDKASGREKHVVNEVYRGPSPFINPFPFHR